MKPTVVKSKVKKAQRKARIRRARKSGRTPVVANAPAAPHVDPREDNQKLHETARFFAEQARGMEKLMDRNRWSRS